jgi:hypothetical protein
VLPPPPPPAEVILEKTEGEPGLKSEQQLLAHPPAPTVIGTAATEAANPAGAAKGLPG